MIGPLLNEVLTVYRATFEDDGRGGRTKTVAVWGTVRARISQPTAEERTVAAQEGATLDAIVHVPYGSGVERGDEIEDVGPRHLRVLSAVHDSSRTYDRLMCQVIQGGHG